MTAILFLAFVGLTALAVAAAIWRFPTEGTWFQLMLGLPAWLAFVGALSYFGVIGNATLRPPGAIYIFVPVFLFIILFAVRSQAGSRLALEVPLSWLIGAQVFRLVVELFLHQLWKEGLVPRLMTYEGGNIDIFIGLSAPLAAWVATRGRSGQRAALLWNVMGLLALANIAARSVMTAPGPLHLLNADVPNIAIGTFPFTFIAGFCAPLAVLLHVLAIRALRSRSAPSPLLAPGLQV